MIIVWFIIYLLVEIFGNATVHLDPMNAWGVTMIVCLAWDAVSS